MKLEDVISKKLEDISFQDISVLGEDIAKVDEKELLKWIRLQKIKSPNIYEHYKFSCIKYEVRHKCRAFFKKDLEFDGKELLSVFNLSSVFDLKLLISSLIKSGYLIKLGNKRYKVVEYNDYDFVNIIISCIWSRSPYNFNCRVNELTTFLTKQLLERFVKDGEFCEEVGYLFGNSKEYLLDKPLDERQEFFRINLLNTSRGYVLRLLTLKFVYKDMVEHMDYFLDLQWLEKLKEKFKLERI